MSGADSDLEEAFEQHWSSVCRTLYTLVGDWAEAEDLALETFWRLYKRPPRDLRNVGGWLYRVATNLGLNALRARKRRQRHEEEAGALRLQRRDVLSPSEDIANARLEFRNGCVANITASRVAPNNLRKIRVFKDDVYVSLDYRKQLGRVYRKQDEKIIKSRVPTMKGEPIVLEIQHFLSCVSNRTKPLVSAEQGTQALEAAVRILDQIRRRK